MINFRLKINSHASHTCQKSLINQQFKIQGIKTVKENFNKIDDASHPEYQFLSL